ncbi:DinB family protein [Haliscomenobacter sp.]|uniref:DinB family protein n=1 Tax=Haliscomenobacter sp. TaxID=2717303 RepID=UPI003364CE83
MTEITQLLAEVQTARQAFIAEVSGLTYEQANFKPDVETWNVVENVEHIVRAEQSGISGLWKAFDALRRNDPVWSGDPIHQGLSADEVIARTWQPKEIVPPIAAPQWGGSLNFWLALLKAQGFMLADFATELEGFDLESLVYPHPISGPMDARQRFDFLKVHMQRHQKQIQKLKDEAGFPKG